MLAETVTSEDPIDESEMQVTFHRTVPISDLISRFQSVRKPTVVVSGRLLGFIFTCF